MTEETLKALMKLFAILANLNKATAGILSRNLVESFLKTRFNNKLIEYSLNIFDEQYDFYAGFRSKSESKRTSFLSVQIIYICNHINNELPVKDRYLILFSLIRFSKFFRERSGSGQVFRQTIGDAVRAISDGMHIEGSEYENCRWFLSGQFYRVRDRESLLVVSDEDEFPFQSINHLSRKNFHGQLFFLKIRQANMLIFYFSGKQKLELNGKLIYSGHIYILPRGSSIRYGKDQSLYSNEIEAAFLSRNLKEKINLTANGIHYSFPRSDNGVHPISFSVESGEYVGIMGGSGSGKSTLMKMLSGRLRLDGGEVRINGHSIHGKQRGGKLRNLTGYVPQEDLLIPDLSVLDNLLYSSMLSLGNVSNEKIRELVNRLLTRLDLHHIKDLKVGNVGDRNISGGQRKRLNIALELIREPHILFVDEPTSGLSSTDSENVMSLLKELTLQGKIVIINIHQPSSAVFNMFDKIIIMDQGGFPVYSGNPARVVSYLKSITGRADKAEIECDSCGTIQTGEILEIIESKKVNEYGEYTEERLLTPFDWYKFYREKENNNAIDVSSENLPRLNFQNPSLWKQFKIYSIRNFLAKAADLQFMLFAFLVPPLLGIILGFFTKYTTTNPEGQEVYLFSANENIPAYIFMSVIVALFVGLIISSGEIIKDRPILYRESFLNLSWFSYLNSKIVFLFGMVAVQMLIFVLTGNAILEIKGLNLDYWLVLFSTAAFAVLLGLNISSGLKSLVAIYINIPFILVPLILLAGVIVEYDKLHNRVSSAEFVPLAGDLMVSRWAYEALVVNQFLNNSYQKKFNQFDKERANLNYEVHFLLPELSRRVYEYQQYMREEDMGKAEEIYLLIMNSISSMNGIPKVDPHTMDELDMYLTARKKASADRIRELNNEIDKLITSMANDNSLKESVVSLKNNYQNESIRDLVLRTRTLRKIVIRNGKLIRKDSPVFQSPVSNTGRAPFYAGTKQLFHLEISTFWFNIGIIWIMCLVLYLFLYLEVLKKIIYVRKGRRITSLFGFKF